MSMPHHYKPTMSRHIIKYTVRSGFLIVLAQVNTDYGLMAITTGHLALTQDCT